MRSYIMYSFKAFCINQALLGYFKGSPKMNIFERYIERAQNTDIYLISRTEVEQICLE